jgi:hypothetical protein
MRGALLIVLPLTLSACSAEPEQTEPAQTEPDPPREAGADSGQMPLDCDIGRLLRGCSASICHHQSRREGDLSLDVADPLGPVIAAELIGVPAAYNVQDRASCPTPRELRVDPDDIDQSLLLKKLDGRFSCGEPMPNAELPEWIPENRPASLACVRAWLTALVAANRAR